MEKKQKVKLTPEQITAIELAISREERIEIVPSKRGAIIFRVRRQEIAPSADGKKPTADKKSE